MATKPSLTPEQAGVQITRDDMTWASAIPAPTPVNISFAFRANPPPTDYDGGGLDDPSVPPTLQDLIDTFTHFSETQINVALAALSLYAEVANISFTRVGTGTTGPDAYSDDATILFANYEVTTVDTGVAAFAYFPVPALAAPLPSLSPGDPFFDRGDPDNKDDGLFPGSYGYATVIHELGHAVGLEHPGSYNAGLGEVIEYERDALFFEDSLQYSVMSYFQAFNTGASHVANSRVIYTSTLLLDDMTALQRFYGANMTTRAGDDIYGFNSNTANVAYHITSADENVVFAVWDAGGTDTFDFSGYATNQVIDLEATHFSSVGDITLNVAIGLGVVIENATGGEGNDEIFGNAVANLLIGGPGNDILEGKGGEDTAGYVHDAAAYLVQNFGSEVLVSGPEGDDTLTGIELLQFADGTIAVDDGNALIDQPYYLSRNPDVFHAGMSAVDHYNTFGFREGRNPNNFFSTDGYLAANPDVAAAGTNPLDHYHQTGWKAGLDPSIAFDTTLYLQQNPDVAAAGVDPLAHFLLFGKTEGRTAHAAIGASIVGGGFDAEFYLLGNPEAGRLGIDPFTHFSSSGWLEGRNPDAFFDTAGYLAQYADVAAAGIDPLGHYAAFGWREGRDPSTLFDTAAYLAANPDVAAAQINPLQHFLQFGVYEGRLPLGDGVWG